MKNIKQLPIAIAITWGKDMIQEQGGLLKFIRAVKDETDDVFGYWMHKCSNGPKCDISTAYIVIGNRVAYQMVYAGYERGPVVGYTADGRRIEITWPRMILSGPMQRAPRKIYMRGFQGFRYIYEPIF